MKLAFFMILIILFYISGSPAFAENQQKEIMINKIPKEDLEIIKVLEILKLMDLMKDYDLVKDMEILIEEDANEDNN